LIWCESGVWQYAELPIDRIKGFSRLTGRIPCWFCGQAQKTSDIAFKGMLFAKNRLWYAATAPILLTAKRAESGVYPEKP